MIRGRKYSGRYRLSMTVMKEKPTYVVVSILLPNEPSITTIYIYITHHHPQQRSIILGRRLGWHKVLTKRYPDDREGVICFFVYYLSRIYLQYDVHFSIYEHVLFETISSTAVFSRRFFPSKLSYYTWWRLFGQAGENLICHSIVFHPNSFGPIAHYFTFSITRFAGTILLSVVIENKNTTRLF